jgi:hypothetical protein
MGNADRTETIILKVLRDEGPLRLLDLDARVVEIIEVLEVGENANFSEAMWRVWEGKVHAKIEKLIREGIIILLANEEYSINQAHPYNAGIKKTKRRGIKKTKRRRIKKTRRIKTRQAYKK